jgi:Mrp family chromosome partitioning ATPase
MLRSRWRVVALVLATGLALAYAATALSPRQYVATGGVLLAEASSGTRMVKVQYAAPDPRAAIALVERFIERQKDPLWVDPPLVTRAAPSLAGNLALGAALALLLSLWLLWRGRRPALRSEKELTQVLGVPLLAARPLAPQGLSQQLLAHWFSRGRAVLAVVSPENGDGRTRVAVELARAFARIGEPTLLIDADVRSPAVHREFGLRNRAGLADFLEGRRVELAHCADNLSVLVAGRSSADPLELLSRKRLQDLLAVAAKRYRVVLVDTPAAVRGPDLQIFAAFAGGALVVSRFSTEIPALERLRDFLAHCRARVVGTVLSPAVPRFS